MNKQMTALAFYEEQGQIPSLFLIIETDEKTEFIFSSDFYIGLIADKYFLTNYAFEILYLGEPVSPGTLTEEGVKLYFPQSEDFCEIDYIKVDMDYLMNIEQ